jgi:hypothetical protein
VFIDEYELKREFAIHIALIASDRFYTEHKRRPGLLAEDNSVLETIAGTIIAVATGQASTELPEGIVEAIQEVSVV